MENAHLWILQMLQKGDDYLAIYPWASLIKI